MYRNLLSIIPEMEYEDYVREQRQKIQQVLISKEEQETHEKEQKMEVLRHDAYNKLLNDYHKQAEILKQKEQEVRDLEEIGAELMQEVESFQERIIEIPYEKIRLMFLLQEKPTKIFLNVDKENKLKWVKAPHEMNGHAS